MSQQKGEIKDRDLSSLRYVILRVNYRGRVAIFCMDVDLLSQEKSCLKKITGIYKY